MTIQCRSLAGHGGRAQKPQEWRRKLFLHFGASHHQVLIASNALRRGHQDCSRGLRQSCSKAGCTAIRPFGRTDSMLSVGSFAHTVQNPCNSLAPMFRYFAHSAVKSTGTSKSASLSSGHLVCYVEQLGGARGKLGVQRKMSQQTSLVFRCKLPPFGLSETTSNRYCSAISTRTSQHGCVCCDSCMW